MSTLHRIVRRTAWRFPRMAMALWLWEWAGCRIQLYVDLPEATAAGLDHAAILGLGHDRDGLELAYRLECGGMHRADCKLAPGFDFRGERGIAGLVAEAASNKWRVYATRMQEDLYDAHGYAPGIYEFDEQSERAILAALHARKHAQSMAAQTPGDDGGEHRSERSDHGGAQHRVLQPTRFHAHLHRLAQHSANRIMAIQAQDAALVLGAIGAALVYSAMRLGVLA